MAKKCIVLSCQRTVGSFFVFPKFSTDIERFLKLISAAGNQSLLNLPVGKISNKYFCKDHFSINSFIYKRLSGSAVPTLKLMHPLGTLKVQLYMYVYHYDYLLLIL